MSATVDPANNSQDIPSSKEIRDIMGLNALSSTERQIFLMDTGASRHLCCLKDLLHNTRPYYAGITVATGVEQFTELVGELHIQVGRSVVKLSNVLYAPWIKHNLISVGTLVTEKRLCLTWKGPDMLIQTEAGETVLSGSHYGVNLACLDYDMILLPQDTAIKPTPNFVVAPSIGRYNTRQETLIAAHLSLCHPSVSTMLNMVGAGKLPGTAADLRSVESVIQDCHSCAFGKSKALPFPKMNNTENRMTGVLERVHSDLMTNLPGRQSNCITITDEYSDYTWAYNTERKSDTLKVFQNWQKLITNQLSTPIKRLQTDNGGEYTGTDFKEWTASLGIMHQFTIPHTPQRNGLAERKNYTIINKTICALANARLPRSWWPFAAGYGIFCMNRTTNSRGFIPWERLHNRTLANVLEDLHPFGCLVVVKDDDRPKMGPRGQSGLFMGYDELRKGYRIYDLTSKSHTTARNCQFFDKEFPGVADMSRSEFVDVQSLQNVLFMNFEDSGLRTSEQSDADLSDSASALTSFTSFGNLLLNEDSKPRW